MSDLPMVKVKTYTLGPRGKRSTVVALPSNWLEDIEAKEGDRITLFRDTADRLVIIKDAAK